MSQSVANEPVGRRLLKVPEVAETLQISPSRAWELIASGDLRSIKLGASRRVPVHAVDEYLARRESEARNASGGS